jgi:hypothetical protein
MRYNRNRSGEDMERKEVQERVKRLVRYGQNKEYIPLRRFYKDFGANIKDRDLNYAFSLIQREGLELREDPEDTVEKHEESEYSDRAELDNPVGVYICQCVQAPLLSRHHELLLARKLDTAKTRMSVLLFGFGIIQKTAISRVKKIIDIPHSMDVEFNLQFQDVNYRKKHRNIINKSIKEANSLIKENERVIEKIVNRDRGWNLLTKKFLKRRTRISLLCISDIS